MPPWPEINADLVCPHGSLALTSGTSSGGPKAKKRLMAAKDWFLLRRFFPRGPSFRAKRLPATGTQGNNTSPTAPLAVTIATAALKSNTSASVSAISPGCGAPLVKTDNGVDVCEICLRESQEQRISQQEEQQQELRRRSEAVPDILASVRERRSGVPTHLLTARAVQYRDDLVKTGSDPGGGGAAAAAGGDVYEGEPSPHTTTILKSPRGAVEESECREALSLQSIEAFPSLPLNESVALQEDAVIDTLGITTFRLSGIR